uniref:Uncharacterized protein n=1 Tax=Arundo donax TaxID=35708 RepID=A0A0A9HUG7_ARUDO
MSLIFHSNKCTKRRKLLHLKQFSAYFQ